MSLRRTSCLSAGFVSVILWTAGCLPAARGPGIGLWAVDAMQAVRPGDAPLLENPVFSASQREIRLTTAINDVVAFQLVVSGDRIDRPMDVEVTDLTGPSGRVAARDAVALYRVRSARLVDFPSWYPGHTGRPASPMDIPDVLVPWTAPRGGGPLRPGAGAQVLWLDIAIPPTAGPGRYTGQLRVRGTADGEVVEAVEIRLRVLPVALPSVPTLPVICRVDPQDLLTAHLDWPREAPETTPLISSAPALRPGVELVRSAMQLLHAHRTNPILWAGFPEYRVVGPREVEIAWGPYDELVHGWLNGDAFDDLVGVAHWPLPVSYSHPDAEREGGLLAPEYARLLAAYLRACAAHFRENGWREQAFVRLLPPTALTEQTVERIGRVAQILRQSGVDLPLVAHVPAASLAGLGWHDAPRIELTGVDRWVPRGMWLEPAVAERQRLLDRATWLAPDQPPYSPPVAAGGRPVDARALPWLAYRYGLAGIWIEDAAAFGSGANRARPEVAAQREHLVYPGAPFGLRNEPVPSVRLKRLRGGILDHALLTLLAQRGRGSFAQETAEQIVPWGGTDACIDNLLMTRPASWLADAALMPLARSLLLHELADDIARPGALSGPQRQRRGDWSLLINEARGVHPRVEGVRLRPAGAALAATIRCSVFNAGSAPLQGNWQVTFVPEGAVEGARTATLSVPPGARRAAQLELEFNEFNPGGNGTLPVGLRWESAQSGALPVAARLAAAACPRLDPPPIIDGVLDDWPLGAGNALADFLRVRANAAPGALPPAASLPTQAFFGMDDTNLYIAARAVIHPAGGLRYAADNRVPISGGGPWGQEVIEILIDPRSARAGTSADIFCLQVKPNAVVVAHRGCRTEPPIGPAVPWQAGAQVAVQREPEAWVFELALPLASLGPAALQNNYWGVNVTRLDAYHGEYSSWAPARDLCYVPGALGNLILLRR